MHFALDLVWIQVTRIPNARDPRMSTDLILLFVFPKPPKKDFLSADESFSDDGSLATSGSMRSPPNATVGGSAPEENEEGDDRNDGDEEAASAPPPTRGREEEQEPAVQATVAPSGDLPELEVARAESRRTSEAEDSAQRDQRASASPQTTLVDAKSDSVKVRDAGTGKEYVLEKVYRIKDLDTGTEFLVDAKDGMEGQGAQVVKRADTGEEISMDQFERNLGLQSPLMREMSRRSGEGGGPRGGAPKLIDSSDDEGEAVRKSRGGGGAKQGGGRKRWFQKGLNSLKHKALNAGDAINEAFLKHKAGQGGPEESTFDEAGPGASGAGGDGDDFWTPGAKPSGRRVKVQVHKKIYKEFTDLRIVQEIGAHKGAVWSMKFSLDGLYLASAGQDEIVRIWQVREGHGNRGDGGDPSSGSAGSATFFHQKPYRLYGGHKANILDLCWSKTQFLLSSSMDKTVRLWHISMNECLRVFSHTDFVTSIQFHPVDDKYFLSGSLDEKARLWSIPEQTVVDWVNVHEMVTAVCFSPDGKKAVIGSYKGKCRFYSVEGNQFEYITQMDVKNTRGKNSRGKKITGLQVRGERETQVCGSTPAKHKTKSDPSASLCLALSLHGTVHAWR